MANFITWLKDRKKQNIIVPKTMTKAVYDDDGVSLDTTLNEISSNLEFHKGDFLKYNLQINGTSLSSALDGSFTVTITLPKAIGSDVTKVTTNASVAWIRKDGSHVSISGTGSTVEVTGFSGNMINLKISHDSITALSYHTVSFNSPLTFAFE